TRDRYPALASWAAATRLNPLGALSLYHDDPLVIQARARIKGCALAATSNIATVLGARSG
ncbi:MAG TPA: hypothetical protein VK702_05650, partial [Candidatus Acidoferrum sp.]|nr:hypothetical protein [Candidatus Acidoferrum sp.]